MKLLLVVALCLSQAACHGPKIFRNEEVGITYSLPAGYVEATPSEAKMPNITRQNMILMADKSTGRPFRSRILLIADSKSNYTTTPKNLEWFSQELTKNLVAKPGHRMDQPTREMKLHGKSFYVSEYTETSEGVKLFKVTIVTESKGHWLAWTAVSPLKEDLIEVKESIFATKFESR